jgi:hypothetical protein
VPLSSLAQHAGGPVLSQAQHFRCFVSPDGTCAGNREIDQIAEKLYSRENDYVLKLSDLRKQCISGRAVVVADDGTSLTLRLHDACREKAVHYPFLLR